MISAIKKLLKPAAAPAPDRSYVLLDHQKARVIDLLSKAGAAPCDFEWVEIQSPSYSYGSRLISKLGHKTNDLFCVFDQGYWEIQMEYSPGNNERRHSVTTHWQEFDENVQKWAEYVARELKAKDYLEVVMSAPEFVELPLTDEDITPFDESEKEPLRRRLRQIEEYVFGLRHDDEAYQNEVRAHFEFLNVQLERSDRKAFFYCVFGTLATIGTAYLGMERTREILRYAAEQFGDMTRLLMHMGHQ